MAIKLIKELQRGKLILTEAGKFAIVQKILNVAVVVYEGGPIGPFFYYIIFLKMLNNEKWK